MQLVNIQTLAFTPQHTLPWRVYLYTHTQCSHSADTPHSTLILGELLCPGEANQKARVKRGTADSDAGMEVKEEQLVRKEMEAAANRLGASRDGEGVEKGVKVTLKQQPRDDKALKEFLTILTTVLNTLSPERD